MVRATNIFSAFLLITIFGGSVCAQYNSDYKTVARKHIKAAIQYTLQDDGDSQFTAMTSKGG